MITPAMELAEKILDQIDRHPETHDQMHWGKINECGTSACIAGWAGLLNGDAEYTPLYSGSETQTLILSPEAEPDGDWILYGARVLELSFNDADKLFMDTNNRQAKEALKYIAKGERPDWKAIYD